MIGLLYKKAILHHADAVTIAFKGAAAVQQQSFNSSDLFQSTLPLVWPIVSTPGPASPVKIIKRLDFKKSLGI